MTFGEKLQKLRARAGLSQDQLAELLDVSRQAVSKWERNEAMPEAEKLVRISRQFGVSTDYLLLEEAEEPEAPKAPAAAAGLWGRIKQWYRNKGYLLAWVLAAWGGVRLLRESVDLARYARSVGALNSLTPEEWCLVLMDPLFLRCRTGGSDGGGGRCPCYPGAENGGKLPLESPGLAPGAGWTAGHGICAALAAPVFGARPVVSDYLCAAGALVGAAAGACEYSVGGPLGDGCLLAGDHLGPGHPHPGPAAGAETPARQNRIMEDPLRRSGFPLRRFSLQKFF